MNWIFNLDSLCKQSVIFLLEVLYQQRMMTCDKMHKSRVSKSSRQIHIYIIWDMLFIFNLSESQLFTCKVGIKAFTVTGRFINNVVKVPSAVSGIQLEFSKCQ